jgi:hypothetical protein
VAGVGARRTAGLAALASSWGHLESKALVHLKGDFARLRFIYRKFPPN